MIVVLFLFFAGHANAKTYRNHIYGFSVELPKGMTACITPPPGVQHGVIVLLEGSDCDLLSNAAYIDFYAGYNVANEAVTTAELAKSECSEGKGAPSDLRIDGLLFYRCTKGSKAHSVDYLALRIRPEKEAYSGIEFDITLYCPKHNCDMKAMRRIISGMHIK